MCSKPGCEKPVRARGFCINHYSSATLELRKENGFVPSDRRKVFTPDELEDYWLWVKKELNLV
jgi:hypothetical protein